MPNVTFRMVFAILVALMLSGCWDRRELNDLSIAVGLGLDKRGDLIEITAQIVNPGEVASRQGISAYRAPVSSFSTTGLSTFEAIRKMTMVAPRQIFTSHLRVMVIGEDMARSGLKKVIDGISRDREFRTDFYLIVAKGLTAKRVLETMTSIEKIPANKLFVSLDAAEKTWAPAVKMQLDRFLSDLIKPAKSTVMTGIVIEGNPEAGKSIENVENIDQPAKLKYAGIAIFKNDKLVDWLNEEESKGYSYIMGHVNNSAGHVNCPNDGKVALEVIRSKSRIKGKIVDGEPRINVELFVEENVGEVQCALDLTKQENLKRIEELGEEKLTRILESAIEKAKKNKADIFGFGEAIEDANPAQWTRLQKDWDERFARLNVSVSVRVKLRRLGTITNSIYE